MKEIKAYYKACEDIGNLFAKTYYADEEDKDYRPDMYWVGDGYDGPLSINDEFFGIDDMITLLENKVSYDDMMTWYYWCMDEFEKSKEGALPLNLKHYLKSNLYKNGK